jgi:hypothetical protein
MAFFTLNSLPNLKSGLPAAFNRIRSPCVLVVDPKLMAPVLVIVIRFVGANDAPAAFLVQNDIELPSYAVAEFLSLMIHAPGVHTLRPDVST